jgi:thymidylate synthase (FAD)
MTVNGIEHKILDHGYVKLIETWGSDYRIIEAARMSTQKGFEGWGDNTPCNYDMAAAQTGKPCKRGMHNCGVDHKVGDERLLRYLWEHNHATPFEMAGMVIEVQAPIFVFREWHRHRTQSYNEMSARYAPLPDLNYYPTVERLMMGGGHLTKQAGTAAGAQTLTEQAASDFVASLHGNYVAAQILYEESLKDGVPKELARLCLPVGRYSRMRASANLRNWLAFLTLRMAKEAQWEIRQYANSVAEIVQQYFPRTYELFAEAR